MLNDNPEDIQAKLKAALTDSIEGVSFSPAGRPGVSNLLTLMACLDKRQRSEEQIAEESQALSMRAFKGEVARTVIEGIAEIKARYDYYIDTAREQHLQEVAALGNEKARRQAEETMLQVRRAVGTDPI